ncbi:leucine-rich repeat domain-containing protein [Neorhodopirellula pilleata]|uniref:Leucine Rich repeats (2 copies) n=1 Tax=Neorhodopirellula pilleata TaxID=2714738 RepID=A0A5C6A6P8_9BACT|nr:hypothetical protein [Neorhodopirellula pilleata]TWT95070.1 hypothetical protein Pla100_36510 [Neorhodopirellula pilleata]
MTDTPSDADPDDSAPHSEVDVSSDDMGDSPDAPVRRSLAVRLKSIGKAKWFVLAGLIFLLGFAAWRWTSPSPLVAPKPLALSASVRFGQEIQDILGGKQTRLYVADYVVDDAMLSSLPIETLRKAKQEALAAKDDPPPANDQDQDQAKDPIYDEAGKRINFDPPAWQDYPKVDTVLIDQGIVTGEGLARIAELPDLEHVRLRLSPITDENLKPLLQCRELWLINLPHSELTNEGIRSLAEIPKLKQLRLGSKNLTNDCCRAIAELTKLRGLHLIGVPVTDDGVKVLAELPHLESLYLDDSAVTDAGWEWVFRNHPELHIHINQKHHDRDPQSHQH